MKTESPVLALRLETVLTELLRSLTLMIGNHPFEDLQTQDLPEIPLDKDLQALISRFSSPVSQGEYLSDGYREIESALQELGSVLKVSQDDLEVLYLLPAYRVWIENSPAIGSGAVWVEPRPDELEKLVAVLTQNIVDSLKTVLPDITSKIPETQTSLRLRFRHHLNGKPRLISHNR